MGRHARLFQVVLLLFRQALQQRLHDLQELRDHGAAASLEEFSFDFRRTQLRLAAAGRELNRKADAILARIRAAWIYSDWLVPYLAGVHVVLLSGTRPLCGKSSLCARLRPVATTLLSRYFFVPSSRQHSLASQ